jgi:hypothetical protein
MRRGEAFHHARHSTQASTEAAVAHIAWAAAAAAEYNSLALAGH